MFIALLSFSESLATKYVFKWWTMVRPTLIYLNPVELKYYSFINDINVKTFNTITNKNEVKTMAKDISCDYKCKFNSTTCSSNQKWNNKTCQCECKNYCTCKKDCSWNPSTCIYENSKYVKSIADTSVIECDEIITVMNIVLTKKTNTRATNVRALL